MLWPIPTAFWDMLDVLRADDLADSGQLLNISKIVEQVFHLHKKDDPEEPDTVYRYG